MDKRRLAVGISGASGAALATELLLQLREQPDVEVHLVYTRGAVLTLCQELGRGPELWESLADHTYSNEDVGAALASGSFRTMGMVVAPCSMKTLAGIHSGYSDTLLLRAADVTLKERRKLVLAVRETPLSPIHLRNMYELSMMGAVILPPMLSYYQSPQSVEDCTRHIVGKLLDQFALESTEFRRWEGMEGQDG